MVLFFLFNLTFLSYTCSQSIPGREISWNVKKRAAIFLGGVVAYIGAEIFKLAGNKARDSRSLSISETHLLDVIIHDRELCELFQPILEKGILRGRVNVRLGDEFLRNLRPEGRCKVFHFSHMKKALKKIGASPYNGKPVKEFLAELEHLLHHTHLAG